MGCTAAQVVSDVMKYKGNYIAVPVNVHRVNWLWANPEAFKKAGAKVPTTWDEFFVAAEALKKAGIVPIAHGGQNWQDFTTFESVALGVGGAEFYKKALVQLDSATLAGTTMEKVLSTFKHVKDYTDKKRPRPGLEPGHRHGHQGRGRHAVDGRLGQG